MYDDDEKTPRMDRPDIRRHQQECGAPGGRLYEIVKLADRQSELMSRLVLQMAIMTSEIREKERSSSRINLWILVLVAVIGLLGRWIP
jgi:hypothetical protein